MSEAHEGWLSVWLSGEKKKPHPQRKAVNTVKWCCANNMMIISEKTVKDKLMNMKIFTASKNERLDMTYERYK